MGLIPRERHALESIEYDLQTSDPRLTRLLVTFNRLAADEALPQRERIGARRPGKRLLGRLIWPLLWLVIAAALISGAMSVSQGGAASCSPWAACGQQAPAHPARTGLVAK